MAVSNLLVYLLAQKDMLFKLKFCLFILSFGYFTIVLGSPWDYDIRVWHPPFHPDSPNIGIKYYPLEKSSRSWSICVSFPHMKDAYWISVNYGIVAEAKRLGVKMNLVEAGGYGNLPVQIEQIKKCSENVDAVIIAAISYDGLNNLVSQLRSRGLVVIDMINGMSTKQMSAKSLVSFIDMGKSVGHYLAVRHPKGFKNVNVAWFPGPKGAGFVSAADKGFKESASQGSVSITSTEYGDLNNKQEQLNLLKAALKKKPDVDYVVGSGVAAEVAVNYLQEINRDIKVLSYYLTPFVYDAISKGSVLASPTDSAVIQGKIAIDQAVRILEGQPVLRHVGPEIHVINADTLGLFPRENFLAPTYFKPVFQVQ